MEEDLDFLYACCWACNSNADKKKKLCRKEVGGFTTGLAWLSQWPVGSLWLLMFPAWKQRQKVKHLFYPSYT